MISYGHVPTEIRPDVGRAGYREPLGNEKSVHVAGDGTVLTYNVGEREFIEITFEYQDETLKTAWETWWDVARVGTPFYFYDDDSYYLSDGSFSSGGGISTNDLQTNGATHREVRVKADMNELDIAESDVWGYYNVALRLRKVP
jgi:hypothetical protein